MKRWLLRLGLLAGLVALGFWGWHVLFPGPEQVIRRRLNELARAATIAPNESPLARLYNAQKLAGFFTPDVEVMVDVPGYSLHTFSGRDNLIEAATGARSTFGSLTVELVDIEVSMNSDKRSARVDLTAKVNRPGESTPQPQELKVDFKKIDGEWLIDRAETVRPLR